jgi:hypothetical protein
MEKQSRCCGQLIRGKIFQGTHWIGGLMRILASFCLLFLISCAQQRGPASLKGANVAHDSMALGNIKASAVKSKINQNVCFEITLNMKNVEQHLASASNWTLAWVDHKSQYHLLSIKQRDPASVPQGGRKTAAFGTYKEWTNTLYACASRAQLGQVKRLILTPKELPYREVKGMELEWN